MIMIRINPKMSNGGYPRPIQSALREIECSVNSALIHCSFQIPTCSIDDLCAPPTYTMKHVCPHPRTNVEFFLWGTSSMIKKFTSFL